MQKYQGQILAIGKRIEELKGEDIIIFFGERAGSGLEEYSHIIPAPPGPVGLSVGDILCLGGVAFPVTAVGNKADNIFGTIGHFTARFDGCAEPSLPGTVHLAGALPKMSVGEWITIERSYP